MMKPDLTNLAKEMQFLFHNI